MGTVHSFPTVGQQRAAALAASIAKVAHPVLTSADIARMTVEERGFFTDEPVAHMIAEADYRRARRIERQNAEAIRAHNERLASARRFADVAWG